MVTPNAGFFASGAKRREARVRLRSSARRALWRRRARERVPQRHLGMGRHHVGPQQFPALAPPETYGQALVYDPVRQRTILSCGSGQRDTWDWNGTNWTRHILSPTPSARSDHAMAYDSDRQRVLLFGGSPTTLAETWEWDGASWLQRMPVTSPLGAYGHAMAYDAARKRMVMVIEDETWLFLP